MAKQSLTDELLVPQQLCCWIKWAKERPCQVWAKGLASSQFPILPPAPSQEELKLVRIGWHCSLAITVTLYIILYIFPIYTWIIVSNGSLNVLAWCGIDSGSKLSGSLTNAISSLLVKFINTHLGINNAHCYSVKMRKGGQQSHNWEIKINKMRTSMLKQISQLLSTSER